MILAEDTAAVVGISLRDICRQIEAGRLHYTETGNGSLLICLDSLIEHVRKEDAR